MIDGSSLIDIVISIQINYENLINLADIYKISVCLFAFIIDL